MNREVAAFREALQDPLAGSEACRAAALSGSRRAHRQGPRGCQCKDAHVVAGRRSCATFRSPRSTTGSRFVAERYRTVLFTPASHARLKDTPRWIGRAWASAFPRPAGPFSALPGVPEELQSIFLTRAECSGTTAAVLPGRILLDESSRKASMQPGAPRAASGGSCTSPATFNSFRAMRPDPSCFWAAASG